MYDPLKKKIYRERGGGQIVVSGDGVAITGVIVQPNSPPDAGEARLLLRRMVFCVRSPVL